MSFPRPCLPHAARPVFLLSAAVIFATPARAVPATLPDADENDTAALPPVEVSAPRVANPESAETFAMPVTALRFDPRVDVQSRSMGEAQADVTIRGGTFENTGVSLGAVPVYDPQTGHYLAEIPVAPAILGIPETRAGAANAQSGWNATAGSIAYGWRPVAPGGAVSLGTGNDSLFTADTYAAFLSPKQFLGRTVGIDLAAAHSAGNGPVQFSDHDFQRYNARLQLRDDTSQTDLFAGFQDKNFAWPNLYAGRVPGGPLREEREDLQTQLYAVNHRQELNGTGDWVQAGAYYRVNEDHYSIPVFNYHARHKTNTAGAALDGRTTLLSAGQSGLGDTALRYRAGVVADDLTSSELRFGNYASRTQFYAGLYADQTVPLAQNREVVLTAGLTYDGANRTSSGYSPAAGVAWRQNDPAARLRNIRLDYAESTQLPTYTALNSAPSGFFGGDAGLGRARSRNIELGADFTADDWEISPAVFYRQDNALVDWVFDPANPASNRSARAVDLDTVGIELLVRRSWQHADLTLGYAWLHRTEDYTTPVTASFYALNFARHRLTAAAVIKLGYGVELRCDNELRFQEKNTLRSGTDTPLLSSIGIAWRIPALDGLSVSAQVDNLWNVNYEEVPLVPGTPRTWTIRATCAW